MDSSRRNFLVADRLPVVAPRPLRSPQPQAPPSGPRTSVRIPHSGQDRLKVTSVGFGCMVTSDGSVVQRGADLGITYFDTARVYSGGNNERMVGAALKGKRNSITVSSKTIPPPARSAQRPDTSLKDWARSPGYLVPASKTKPEESPTT